MAWPVVDLRRTLDLDAPLDKLWLLVSDTDRVNRMLGLPATERAEPSQNLRRVVHGHLVGIPVTWHEYPFEWVYEQSFESIRTFNAPVPFYSIRTYTRLAPISPTRTRAETGIAIEPRNAFGWLLARLVFGVKTLNDLERIYRRLAVHARAAEDAPAPPPPLRRPRVNEQRLGQAVARLSAIGLRPALIERLAAHVRHADDPAVVRMRPFALADRWGEDRLETLRLFLHATRAGLLDLEWDVLCPNCRGPSVRTTSLSALVTDAHCDSCSIRYDINFDESVEARFSVHPDVRDAYDAPYCIGGPANTRHIIAQFWVPAGSEKQVQLHLAPGAYRFRGPYLAERAPIEVAEGVAADTVLLHLEPDRVVVTGGIARSGPIRLTAANSTGENQLVILEQSAWDAQAASAALVTALAEFRQLFSSEVLAPGIGLSIRSLTFLFSDLKGSTMIYEQIGDSPAYARVRDHFAIMQAVITRWRGTLVKTIGDAVMAVFASADDAVQASLEIQHEFTLGEIARGHPALRVKLGLHRGPCIAVNANNLLDYFGSTVNIAARVQNESNGGDIVLTPAVLDDPEVQRVLQEVMPHCEQFERMLRGFDRSFTLYRIWLPQEVAALSDDA